MPNDRRTACGAARLSAEGLFGGLEWPYSPGRRRKEPPIAGNLIVRGGAFGVNFAGRATSKTKGPAGG
jgi:hypothetical protein